MSLLPALRTAPAWVRRLDQLLPAREVEQIDREAEVDPRAVGMTAGDVDAIWSAARDAYETGVHPALALCIRRGGQIIMKRSLGHASGNGPDDAGKPRIACTPDTPFCIFSASKAITAVVMHMLDDRGLLHIDDAVQEYLPEFQGPQKERITIRHVLTHRAGIPSVPAEYATPELFHDWDRVVKLLCEAEPTSIPGRRLAYHAITGGFILGEIVQRVTGRSIRNVLQKDILDPLGFERMNYGVPEADIPLVAQSAFTGPPVPWPLAPLVERALGARFEVAAEIAHDPRFLTSVVPSGNVVASADEASRFFQVLLDGGIADGVRILEPRTIRRACNESSYLEMDFTLFFPVRYGLGFMLGSDRISLFGPRTPRAFGHLGFMNTLIWADPDRDISVALLTSGKAFLSPHLFPLARLVGAIGRHCPPGPLRRPSP
ncbi:MAG: class A beta-lactamase-related serine hydrolase [Deltaproteobacteria bacterium]|nr:MAG: class A beta-lactamase-related serine hydrolase [Deltaproteobacteria bacterium]